MRRTLLWKKKHTYKIQNTFFGPNNQCNESQNLR